MCSLLRPHTLLSVTENQNQLVAEQSLFNVLLTVHPGIFRVNDQLDGQLRCITRLLL